MSIKQKIFLSIFATACVLVGAASYVAFLTARSQLEQQYVERYGSLSSLLSHTFFQLERNADNISLSALEYLRNQISNGKIPDNETLGDMARKLNVSRLFVIAPDGMFIRDSGGVERLPKFSLFDLCTGYRELITGGSSIEVTPIVPDRPYSGAHKFVMVPDLERNYILEAGMRLDFISEVLKGVLDADKKVISVALTSPSGQVLGRMSASSIDYAPTDSIKVPTSFGEQINWVEGTAVFTRKMVLNNSRCCECQVKGVSAEDGTYYYILQTSVSLRPLSEDIYHLTLSVVAACAVALFLSLLLAQWLSRQLLNRIDRISNTASNIVTFGDLSLRLNESGSDEAAALAQNFDRMIDTIQAQQHKIVNSERDRVLGNIASQVAHDVRSPLTALETVLANTKGIEEEKRVMIRTATKRIKDIANNLLEVYKTDKSAQAKQRGKRPYHVGMLVDSIVSEKRVRYGEHEKLQIDADIAEDALDLFLDVDQNDLKRVLSNLIDNAVEALRYLQGTVVVRLLQLNGLVVIEVRDSGIGIHPDRIKKLMTSSASYGKDSGHGIGLTYVRERCAKWGASFSLESAEGKGTVARIRINSVPPPSWFTSIISVRMDHLVLIADDDPSIHQVWRNRFAGGVEPLSVHTLAEFEQKVRELQAQHRPFMALVDYEFIGESRTGIDAIKLLDITASAVLVTSRHDEELITERCTDLRLKMIPKGIAPAIPIKYVSEELTYVFLDDDPFILEAWEIEARQKGVKLKTFSDVASMLVAAQSLPKDTMFYLDHNLGGELSGIDVAMQLHQLGFQEIFLSTGYDANHFKDIKVVKGVFGKEPPF